MIRPVYIRPGSQKNFVKIGDVKECGATRIIFDASTYEQEPGEKSYRLYFVNPAGVGYWRDMQLDGTDAIYDVRESDTVVHGLGELQIEVRGADGTRMLFRKWEMYIDGSIPEEMDEMLEPLAPLLEEIEELRTPIVEALESERERVKAENGRAQAESSRADAETARVAAEKQRASAETTRASSETARVEAETKRVQAENTRAEAESSRADVETARVAAEKQRASAETTRASSETARAEAETKRAQAEEARAQTFAGYESVIARLPYSTLEKAIETHYAMLRTGKIYGVKVPKFAANPTTTCTRLADAVGMEYAASTDTVNGKDDFIDTVPLFDWVHVNYVRDVDGSPRPIAIEGTPEYKTAGDVDVGAMQMSFYLKVVDMDEAQEIYISDTAHEGFTPWPECVTAEGEVLPWCIGSAYLSGIASDGLLRSQPGLAVELWQSHNNMIANYQKKGAGYWGAGAVRNSFGILMQLIKMANKSSQATWAGCTNYNYQYAAAAERTEKETYFPVTPAQAQDLVVGSAVSVGYAGLVSGAANTDRGQNNIHKYAKQARIVSIEAISDTMSAVYLDVEEGFTTEQVALSDTVTSPVYLSTMPWSAGSTDAVQGKHDGSAISNSGGKMPYRVQGREYNLGCYEVASDTVMDCKTGGYDVYAAPKGVAHSTSDATIRSTYRKIGTMPDATGDQLAGDINIDPVTGAWIIAAFGGSAAQGMGDKCHGAGGQTGTREYLQRGVLWSGSDAGCAYLACWYWLDGAYWHCGAGD